MVESRNNGRTTVECMYVKLEVVRKWHFLLKQRSHSRRKNTVNNKNAVKNRHINLFEDAFGKTKTMNFLNVVPWASHLPNP